VSVSFDRVQQWETIRDRLVTRRISSFVEPLVIGACGVAGAWFSGVAWVGIGIVLLYGIRVVLREVLTLNQLLYQQFAFQEDQHRRTRMVLGWLLARTDDPDWAQNQREGLAYQAKRRAMTGSPQGEESDLDDGDDEGYLDPEWIEKRIDKWIQRGEEADRWS